MSLRPLSVNIRDNRGTSGPPFLLYCIIWLCRLEPFHEHGEHLNGFWCIFGLPTIQVPMMHTSKSQILLVFCVWWLCSLKLALIISLSLPWQVKLYSRWLLSCYLYSQAQFARLSILTDTCTNVHVCVSALLWAILTTWYNTIMISVHPCTLHILLNSGFGFYLVMLIFY